MKRRRRGGDQTGFSNVNRCLEDLRSEYSQLENEANEASARRDEFLRKCKHQILQFVELKNTIADIEVNHSHLQDQMGRVHVRRRKRKLSQLNSHLPLFADADADSSPRPRKARKTDSALTPTTSTTVALTPESHVQIADVQTASEGPAAPSDIPHSNDASSKNAISSSSLTEKSTETAAASLPVDHESSGDGTANAGAEPDAAPTAAGSPDAPGANTTPTDTAPSGDASSSDAASSAPPPVENASGDKQGEVSPVRKAKKPKPKPKSKGGGSKVSPFTSPYDPLTRALPRFVGMPVQPGDGHDVKSAQPTAGRGPRVYDILHIAPAPFDLNSELLVPPKGMSHASIAARIPNPLRPASYCYPSPLPPGGMTHQMSLPLGVGLGVMPGSARLPTPTIPMSFSGVQPPPPPTIASGIVVPASQAVLSAPRVRAQESTASPQEPVKEKNAQDTARFVAARVAARIPQAQRRFPTALPTMGTAPRMLPPGGLPGVVSATTASGVPASAGVLPQVSMSAMTSVIPPLATTVLAPTGVLPPPAVLPPGSTAAVGVPVSESPAAGDTNLPPTGVPGVVRTPPELVSAVTGPSSGVLPGVMVRPPSLVALPSPFASVINPVMSGGPVKQQDMLRTEGSDWVVVHTIRSDATTDPQPDMKLEHSIDHESVVCAVRYSACGKFLATGSSRCARLYHAGTGRLHKIFENRTRDSKDEEDEGYTEESYCRAVAFSPDGRFFAAGADDQSVKVWKFDNDDMPLFHVLRGHALDIYSLDYSADSRLLVSGSGDGRAMVWSTENGRCMYSLGRDTSGPKQGVTSVAVSPNGRYIACGSLDCVVRLWDLAEGVFVSALKGHDDSVYSVAFSPDSNSLVSASLDKTLRIWDLSSRPFRTRSTLVGHRDYVLSVCFSPDGKWLVSGSKDRSVQFWDAQNSCMQCMLQGHKNSVICIAMNPTSQSFATGSGDFRCRVWSY